MFNSSQRKCLNCGNPIMSLGNSVFCSQSCEEAMKNIKDKKNFTNPQIENSLFLKTIKNLATKQEEAKSQNLKNKGVITLIIGIWILGNLIVGIIIAITQFK